MMTKETFRSVGSKSRDYEERQEGKKKRKVFVIAHVILRTAAMFYSQCPKQRKSPPGNIEYRSLILGEIPLFRALASNMVPMMNH